MDMLVMFPNELTKSMLDEYLDGYSLRDIAKLHNCSAMTVLRKLKHLPEYQEAVKTTKFDLKKALELRSQQLSYETIARELGNTTSSTVRRHLLKYEKERGVKHETSN